MGKFEKSKTNQKQTRKYIQLGIGAVVVVLLAVMPMTAAKREASEGSDASILSATVETKDIDTQIIGGGQLSSAGSLNIRIPENVKLTQYLVGNGDTVLEGDAIARVDRVSVMSAIMELQETLDHLSQEISSAVANTESDSVRAQAGGIVKAVYGQRGESVQDVMLRDGCLAVLSLDGLMAVKIERHTALDIGDKVCVYLPDGTEVEGRVAGNQEDVLTVTVEDNQYEIGTKVTVKTEDGERIGSGALYIFSQWNAAAYSGRISDIQVRKNEKVAAGRLMFLLEDSGNTAQFQRLVDQRKNYEALMQELFALYQTETIFAPCDGIVSGVDEDGAYLLARQEQGLVAQLLSFFKSEQKTGFTVFAVQVTEPTERGMTLKIDPSAAYVEDITRLSATAVDPSEMTQTWRYVGETSVYTQDETGLLQPAGNAKAGDLLLMVGSEEQIGWFVIPDEDVDPKENDGQQQSGFKAVLTSVEEYAEEQQTNEEDTAILTEEDQTEADSDTPWFRRPGKGGWPGRFEDETDDGETGDEESSDGDDETGDGDDETGDGDDETGDGDDETGDGDDETGDGDDETGDSDDETGDGGDQSGDGDTENAAYYLGYIAQVTAISDGTMTVNRQDPAYAVTSLETLANVIIDASALTTEATYTSEAISADMAEVGDYLRLTVALDGTTLQEFAAHTMTSRDGNTGDGTAGEGASGENQKGEGRPSGGTTGGSVGQSQTFTLYTEEKLTVASVTSQEHMTVSITIDELDITKIHVGQDATVSVDALGGEQFEAMITNISNSGENEGGNSKFAVELTLAKSGEMLPGMYSSVFITLETKKNVPCVPVAALEKSGTDTILYTSCDMENGILESPVVVRIGSSDGEYAEILDGLEPGQICYYEYYDTYLETDAPQQNGFSFNQMGRR